MAHPFHLVDVFCSDAYSGNPLAVVVGASEVATEDMQRFANFMNLSETAFLLPPTSDEADYAVRIFTPSTELPFAGHPTLGTCQVWLDTGGKPKAHGRIVQECGVGMVPIAIDGDRLAFQAPPMVRFGPLSSDEIATFSGQLGVDPKTVVDGAWVDNGPGWAALLLPDAQSVLDIELARVDSKLGVVGPYLGAVGAHSGASVDAAFEVRAFFSTNGSPAEDPVTGSLNASVAQWLVGSGRATPPYQVTQGTALGRAGRVAITQDAAGGIWVGGQVATCVTGSVNL
jgi:PhzF family phenazine biosynthesis protein